MIKEETKKQFLKNTKFIIDGMLSNNYDLEEKIKQLKDKEDKIKTICLKNESGTVYYLEDHKGTVEKRILQILNKGNNDDKKE